MAWLVSPVWLDWWLVWLPVTRLSWLIVTPPQGTLAILILPTQYCPAQTDQAQGQETENKTENNNLIYD